MIAPPKQYLLFCKVSAQVVINEILSNIRGEDAKIEALCQFISDDAFKYKGMFESNCKFNANILSLCIVYQIIEKVSSHLKQK